MGAEQLQTPHPAPKHPNFLKPVAGTALLFLLAAGLARQAFMRHDESPGPSEEETAKLQKRLREIDESEQYALVANVDGWYACLHKGRPGFHLHAGEVWKYGVTSKGEFGRYTAAFLLQNKVSYVVQFRGNFAECLKQEQIKLVAYPYLPENLARPEADQLPRPPYNPIMR